MIPEGNAEEDPDGHLAGIPTRLPIGLPTGILVNVRCNELFGQGHSMRKLIADSGRAPGRAMTSLG